MAEYYAIVTDLGVKKMLEAVNEEKKVNITEFAVGDGGGSCYAPDATMEGLKNEVWRGGVDSCRISPESENVLIIESVIPSDVGGFTIREMGIFDSEGAMIAVCNTPDTQKVRVTDGVVHELDLSMEIALSNADCVELVVDPSVVTATKKDIRELRQQKLDKDALAPGDGIDITDTEEGKKVISVKAEILDDIDTLKQENEEQAESISSLGTAHSDLSARTDELETAQAELASRTETLETATETLETKMQAMETASADMTKVYIQEEEPEDKTGLWIW